MNKNELITRHAEQTWEALYTCLDSYGIRYGLDYLDVSFGNSPLIMTFSLSMINTTNWEKFSSLQHDLTQAAQISDQNKVRLGYTGLDYHIEVPKEKYLHNSIEINDIYEQSRGLNVGIGVSAKNNKCFSIDFTPDTMGHMIVSGSTRCGKTNILKIIAMMLMYKNSPDNVRIAIIDIIKSKGKYGALINSSHLATELINTRHKAIVFLSWVRNMIIKLEGRKLDKKIIIIIDEIYLLLKKEDGTDDKKMKALLSYIASAGAEVGFHLISASQYTKIDDIGGSQVKGNMMTSVTGKVKSHYDSLNATGQPGIGAENLMTPGDFLAVNNLSNEISRIAVPEVFDSYFKGVGRGMTPIMNIDDEGEIQEQTTTTTPNVSACFESIDHRLLKLALTGKNKRTNKPYGADVIRRASQVLAERGMGKSIGQGTAQYYVNFAKKLREG